MFATGNSKVDNYDQLLEQIDLFRKRGMGNYRDLLLTIAKNPTMIFWLDNNQNHGTAVNENWGRELLELFSLGAGNYTEVDVREASRAFTGWTFETKIPRLPYGRFPWKFEYRPEDHDDGVKTFLGHTRQLQRRGHHRHRRAAAGLRASSSAGTCTTSSSPMSRRYPPGRSNRRATRRRSRCWRRCSSDSKCEIKPVLRTLFNSDFFKKARYQHLKSPAEVVVGTLRLVGGYELPKPGYGELSMQPSYMGQDLLNPPSVEGWHTGKEWINSGSLMSRINFVAEQVGNPDLPGVQAIIEPAEGAGHAKTPEQLVDQLPRPAGPGRGRRRHQEGADRPGEAVGRDPLGQRRACQLAAKRAAEMLQLIVATREYQFG